MVWPNSVYVANSTKTVDDLQMWHERMAHQAKSHVMKFLKDNNIEVSDKNAANKVCDGCMYGKHHRQTFSEKVDRATEAREIIHSDLCGPMSVESLGQKRYYVLFKDDFSSYRKVYFVKHKWEVANKLECFCEEVKNNFDCYFNELKTDDGKEYKNRHIREVLEKRGIKHAEHIPYTPELNGIAERENRTLMEAARSMLYSKPDLPKSLWAEAVNTAAYVLNRTAPTKVDGKTPYELWFGKRASITKTLRVFGSKCFVHVPKEKRKKLDKKALEGFMVGYVEGTNGYRVWIPELNDVIVSRDVVFKEEISPSNETRTNQPQEDKQEDEGVASEDEDEESKVKKTLTLQKNLKKMTELKKLKKPDSYVIEIG